MKQYSLDISSGLFFQSPGPGPEVLPVTMNKMQYWRDKCRCICGTFLLEYATEQQVNDTQFDGHGDSLNEWSCLIIQEMHSSR